MQNPEAFFDILSIVTELEPALGPLGRLEIQRTCYLSCLLALFDNQAVSDWGYRFARTAYGTPYSADVNDAIDAMVALGLLQETAQESLSSHFSVASQGADMFDALRQFGTLGKRRRYTEAASGSAIMARPAIYSEGLENEPTVRRALQRESGGALLEGPALELLYEQFKGLVEVLGNNLDELITPSLLWISSVAEQAVTIRKASSNA